MPNQLSSNQLSSRLCHSIWFYVCFDIFLKVEKNLATDTITNVKTKILYTFWYGIGQSIHPDKAVYS